MRHWHANSQISAFTHEDIKQDKVQVSVITKINFLLQRYTVGSDKQLRDSLHFSTKITQYSNASALRKICMAVILPESILMEICMGDCLASERLDKDLPGLLYCL